MKSNIEHSIPWTKTSDPVKRLRLDISGAVQGVGFRPFVYRVANDLGLSGWISNSVHGVEIELEGAPKLLDEFLLSLQSKKPAHAYIGEVIRKDIKPKFTHGFEILQSQKHGEKSALVLPDISICPECLAEIFDKNNRRYLYPFTNCTNCGPRYSIIEGLPYDRANTSMKSFRMCDECRAEYENPLNRRFHAQPNACPKCGPRLELWDRHGNVLASHAEAMELACKAVKDGEILALKGLGGFHLIVEADNLQAVQRLRELKGRNEKPFALMYPDIEQVEHDCELNELEAKLLTSSESPIVLLKRRKFQEHQSSHKLESIAPGNPNLGVMLPYTPLHHILMRSLQFPIVATSGNLSEEPICTDEHDALKRLGGIADLFLVHNRPIVRHVDDSIVRILAGRELILRRARGYAPLPIPVERAMGSFLAVGGHQKNTIAVSSDKNIFLSQHIGDLESKRAYDTFSGTIKSLSKIYDFKPALIACDKHPDYLSSQYAEQSGLHLISVQHHYAHILSCMAENNLQSPVMGVAWDGTGYGDDGTIWGGEFLLVDKKSYHRAAHLRTFPLPGGERAILRPRRSALGLLYEIYGKEIVAIDRYNPLLNFEPRQRGALLDVLKKEINCPRTSSAGRFFDAIASIIDLRQVNDFEGQAPMELEFAALEADCSETYDFELRHDDKTYIVDWEKIVTGVFDDLNSGQSANMIAARVHNTLAEIIVEVARIHGIKNIALSGGCFQNKYLTEETIKRLRKAGFAPHWHRLVPPNDGGISLGQTAAACREKYLE